jgi:DNA (cytosine-5)-methyltransferase 1
MLRITEEVKPSFVFAENVQKAPIDRAIEDLQSLGYRAKKCSLSASSIGLDHIRARWWLLAYTDNQKQLCGSINAKMAELPTIRDGIRKFQAEAVERGNEDVVAHRMDRLKAIGNGQVPAVAALAWETLYERIMIK